jgi:succinate dehydrogenase/fumarate reductase flavoprotein subunit
MASASGSYDVVLGSGIAGLAGALAAHALGSRVAVLEKAAMLSGRHN